MPTSLPHATLKPDWGKLATSLYLRFFLPSTRASAHLDTFLCRKTTRPLPHRDFSSSVREEIASPELFCSLTFCVLTWKWRGGSPGVPRQEYISLTRPRDARVIGHRIQCCGYITSSFGLVSFRHSFIYDGNLMAVSQQIKFFNVPLHIYKSFLFTMNFNLQTIRLLRYKQWYPIISTFTWNIFSIVPIAGVIVVNCLLKYHC